MVYCAANWYCFCLTEQTQRGRESKSRRDAPARRAPGGAGAAGTPCPPRPAASPGVTHPRGFVVALWVPWASLMDEPSRARLAVSPVQVCVVLLRAGSCRWVRRGGILVGPAALLQCSSVVSCRNVAEPRAGSGMWLHLLP